jgi:hypothetical protein
MVMYKRRLKICIEKENKDNQKTLRGLEIEPYKITLNC